MCVKVLFHSFGHVHVYCHFVMNMDICQIPMILFVAIVVFDFICSNSAISLQLNMSLFEPYRSLSLLPLFFFPGIGHISLKMTTIVKYPYNQWGEKNDKICVIIDNICLSARLKCSERFTIDQKFHWKQFHSICPPS